MSLESSYYDLVSGYNDIFTLSSRPILSLYREYFDVTLFGFRKVEFTEIVKRIRLPA